jgi:hypothetical protein
MKWFGESWGAPVCDPENHVPVPIHHECIHCGDPIEPDDQGLILPYSGMSPSDPAWVPYHKMCLFASILPVVVHALREGLPLCGFTTEVPARWPHLHYWSNRPKQLTCRGCIETFEA